MTLSLTHKFVSTVPDGADTSVVRPSNWNDTHDVSGTLPVANGGTNTSATPANGQLLIGNGTDYTLANLTAGTGVTITNTAGGISISAPENGTVTEVTATSPLASSGGTAPDISLTGIVPVANGGTGASDAPTARANLSAAASGANSDITSLSGITGAISTVDSITFDTAAAVSVTPGQIAWNANDGCLDIGMGYDAVVQQVGLETYFRIKASSAITNGQLVMFTGAVGASGVITGAPTSTSLTEGLVVMGVATMDIPLNDFGYVTNFGLVRGIDTTGTSVGETWATGDILYYNPAYVGGMTNVRPTSPSEVVVVAAVTNAGPGGSGSLFIRVSFYPKLVELSDVYAPSPTNGKTLIYNATTGRWEGNTLTAGTGVNIVNGAGTITISAPDVGSVTSVDVSGGTTGLTTSGGPITGSGTITLDGTLGVANGGTGATTLTGYVKGSGTSAFTASSTIPTSDLSGTISLTSQVTGTLPVANGGTNSTVSPTAGAVAYGTGTAYDFTTVGSAGQVLTSNGASAPTWATPAATGVTSVSQTFTGGLISVSGSPITSSGTLALTVAGTSGGIPYFSSGTSWASTAAGTTGQFLKSNGAGAPTWEDASSVYTKTTFTATAGQTTFNVTYTVGYIDVYLNGVKLTTSEYTATNGTSVVLGTAAALNDIVETIAWTVWTATNTNIGVGTGTSLVLSGTSANILAAGPAGATNPTLNIDASTASAATGLNVKSAAAAGGMALSVISSGTNENLTIDAKGSGTVTINGTATGAVKIGSAGYPKTAGTSGNFLKSDGTNWTSSAPTLVTIQKLTSGSSATYTPTSGALFIRVTIIGGGGGGNGTGTTTNVGSTGGTTSFNSVTAIGGGGGNASSSATRWGGIGGTGGADNSLVVYRTPGVAGSGPLTEWISGTTVSLKGGNGGGRGAGLGGTRTTNRDGQAGAANSGGGGGGGVVPVNTFADAASFYPGVGGGSGEIAVFWLSATTYTYTVGGGGAGGAAGTSGFAGGTGGTGLIIVEEYYQ